MAEGWMPSSRRNLILLLSSEVLLIPRARKSEDDASMVRRSMQRPPRRTKRVSPVGGRRVARQEYVTLSCHTRDLASALSFPPQESSCDSRRSPWHRHWPPRFPPPRWHRPRSSGGI